MDISGNSRVLIHICTICFDAGDLRELDNVVISLSKKRGLIKQAVAAMVQKCLEWISTTTDLERRMQLVSTVRNVTEGKIYVEVERARVTRILADIHEKAGDIKQAACVMQELQVETFGSMEKREKVEFILEQIRLSITVDEYQKAMLMSRKVTNKTFETAGFEDLKLRYLDLMIHLAVHDQKYMECCTHYRSVMGISTVKSDDAKFIAALKMAVIFVVLAAHSNEQFDLMNILYREKRIEQIPLYREFLQTFLTRELVRWPVVEQAFGEELRSFSHLFGTDEESKLRWRHLCERVVEHNIRTISGYYNSITMKRFAELLDLSTGIAEETLAKLVASGMVYAKIDRTTSIITFAASKSADTILNQWNTQVDSLLSLMVKTNHQIAKEEMVHAALSKQPK